MGGTRKEVKDWAGVEYLGLYMSMNQKWNYCAMFDTENYDDFLKMAWKVPRPKYMTHYVTELLINSTIR